MPDRSILIGMIEAASDFAERRFAQHGEIRPIYQAITAEGQVLIVPAPSFSKDASAEIMRALFELKNVVRYVFMDEAWGLLGTNDAEMRKWFDRGLDQHPDRQEVVFFSGEDEYGQMTAQRPIIRPAGEKARLGPLVINPPFQAAEGRLVGMLPQRGKPS